MAVNYFIYNGHSSEEFNIKVEKWPNLEVPTRVVEKVSVPGRNGDLLLDTGAFSNVEMEYEIYFNAKKEGFFEISKDILRWLLGSRGYLRLEDSYDPDIYRMALLADQERLKDFMGYMGRTTIKFDCKPQRWLKSGEYEQTLTSGETINNAWMPCYPIFSLTGSGTLTVNGNSIAISNNLNKTIVIDCETQNAYTGAENRNSDIRITGDFPYLESGENEITFNNASCTMVPRWWTL